MNPATILQVFHTMKVGGVGSYLLNLCSELVGRGHRVLLAGPEGELTPKFRRRGVDCRPVSIKDWRLLQARQELASLIQEEGVEVVNAHDYSAGAASFLATRKTTTPYLLTIHCRRPAWQRFVVFYWSTKVLTASESLRASLIHELGLAPERVIRTLIGIDTARFAPAPMDASLLAGLRMSTANTVVLHVSRLSSTKSPVGFALVGAASELARANADLLVLVAGSGEHEGKLRAAADRANAGANRTLVRVLGARTDIPDLMRLAAVVVGTGSVALEAMASGRPVVAAGKAGFIGLVTPETFPGAHAAWFGDHSAPMLLSSRVMTDALGPLLLDPADRRVLGTWGRRVIVEAFSTEKMTDHVEGIYAELLLRRSARTPRD